MSLDYSVAAMAVVAALKDGDEKLAPTLKTAPGKVDMFRRGQGSTDPGIMLSRHHSEQNVDGSFDIKNTDGGYVANVSLSSIGKVTVSLA